jgi:serine protease Do
MAVRKTGFIVGIVAGAGVAAAALAGAGFRLPPANAEGQPSLIRASTAPIFAPPPGAPLSFADIFDRVSPAVVSIEVTSKVDRRALQRIPGLPFDILPKGAPPEGEEAPEAMSSGSGFFISADGYVVTNNHVVENASEIKIVLKDERELKATIVGRDEGTDLAVLKVEGRNFPFVDFENSATPRVGDWVIAVGNPFGLGGTATAGIISAYGRDIGETFVDYIQIDAPINRGNSGGPTFDIYGRVIGVNTAIFSPSGGSVGIGFAIPSNVADTITKQLISGGKVTRGYLGATIQNVTPEIAESMGIAGRKGALVAELVPGGPAEKSGLRSGDVVVAINGVKVEDASDLTRNVAASKSGDNLRIEVLREGKPLTVNVRSGVRPSERELNRGANDNDDNGAPGSTTPPPSAVRPTALGLTLAPLDEAARRTFSIPGNVRGAVVEGLASASDAAKKGIKRGDVIVRANDRPVAGPSDVVAAVDAARRSGRPSVLLFIYRDGRQLGVPVKLQ